MKLYLSPQAILDPRKLMLQLCVDEERAARPLRLIARGKPERIVPRPEPKPPSAA